MLTKNYVAVWRHYTVMGLMHTVSFPILLIWAMAQPDYDRSGLGALLE